MELTSHHQLEELRKGQKEREYASPYVLPESSSLESSLSEWCHQEGPGVRITDQRPPRNESPHHKPETTSHVQRVLPGPSPCCCLPGAPANKVSCFVSTRVSSDNSLLSAGQEPALRPWKGSLFLQQDWTRAYICRAFDSLQQSLPGSQCKSDSHFLGICSVPSSRVALPVLSRENLDSC